MADPLLPASLMIHSIASGQPVERRRQPEAALPGQPLGPPDQFRRALEASIGSGAVRFSAHALRRIESRGIELGSADLDALAQAVDLAAGKGSRDSLVLGENYALVVNVPSRTVITALDKAGLDEQIVSSIDSAVFLKRPEDGQEARGLAVSPGI